MKKFIKNDEGTTAIEFSLLAVPYLMLTLAILEIAIMYASASLLEGATSSAARMIRTGELQQSGIDPESAFREGLCNYATVLIDCNDVMVESITLTSFGDAASYPPQYDADGNLVSQGFDAGGSDDRILIRVAYRYQMMTPFVGPLLAGSDNSRLFMSTIVLQVEPYDFAGAGA
ncbi:MAG: pilus assembly protein [Rhodospirillales bacterium]|nr:pilus assembly protein [Rhodospirillales bacterium]